MKIVMKMEEKNGRTMRELVLSLAAVWESLQAAAQSLNSSNFYLDGDGQIVFKTTEHIIRLQYVSFEPKYVVIMRIGTLASYTMSIDQQDKTTDSDTFTPSGTYASFKSVGEQGWVDVVTKHLDLIIHLVPAPVS